MSAAPGRPLRILLVTIDFPLPVNAGGVVRLIGISEALARRGHELTMLARLREPDTDPSLVGALSERLGGATVEVFSAPQRPAPSGPARVLGRWAWSTATRTPPWVWTAYSRQMAARARELAESGDFDVALILEYGGILLPTMFRFVELSPHGTGRMGRAERCSGPG